MGPLQLWWGTGEKGAGMGASHLTSELVGWVCPAFLAGVSLTPSPHLPPSATSSLSQSRGSALPWPGVALGLLAGRGSRCANKEAAACLVGQGFRVNICYLPDGNEA